jgi:VIT1/CCC1 family predicted Fe2+/Mn2+ transporter
VSVSAHVAEQHRSHRSGWLRAAVLGANDGLLSVAGLVIGVAAANASRAALVTAGLAGLVAGAMSMAVGEYISVSTQRDAEQADIRIEAEAIAENRRAEMHELAKIYEERGVEPGLARLVADQLMAHDAVGAHARDELGISDIATARPLQAALVSVAAFTAGGLIPVLAITVPDKAVRIGVTAAVCVVALFGLGALGAQLGGAPRLRAAVRVATLSVLAMVVTYVIGRVVGANV